MKSNQVENKMRKAQLEPLQEKTYKILTKLDVAKGQLENIKLEAKEIVKENISA
jgi:hypothetical protein